VNVKLALLAPVVVGAKTTLIEQAAEAANVDPQVLPLVLNCPESAPLKAMLEMFSVVFPVLVSVTALLLLDVPVFWFPNAMEVGASPTTAATPVPVSESVAFTVPCSVNVAVRLPEAEGVKVRLMVQDPLAAIVPPLVQVPVPALA